MGQCLLIGSVFIVRVSLKLLFGSVFMFKQVCFKSGRVFYNRSFGSVLGTRIGVIFLFIWLFFASWFFSDSDTLVRIARSVDVWRFAVSHSCNDTEHLWNIPRRCRKKWIFCSGKCFYLWYFTCDKCERSNPGAIKNMLPFMTS